MMLAALTVRSHSQSTLRHTGKATAWDPAFSEPLHPKRVGGWSRRGIRISTERTALVTQGSGHP
jgi:hypothetical protein